MTAANEPAKVIPRTHVTAVPSVSLQTKQNRTAEQLHQAAVPVLQKDSLSYVQFVQDFMQPNLPVMIQVMGVPFLSACTCLCSQSKYALHCYMLA